jgi:hypothetical protein
MVARFVIEKDRGCGQSAGNVVATTRDANGWNPCPEKAVRLQPERK